MIKNIILKYPALGQFSKFIIVGLMNTAIDFLILNLLMRAAEIYQGKWIILLNVISFSIAIINSYLWNKYWTFKSREQAPAPLEISQFLIVTLIGASINSGIIYGLTTYIPAVFGLGKELWANFSKVIATGFSLVWNFIGYKFIVFRR